MASRVRLPPGTRFEAIDMPSPVGSIPAEVSCSSCRFFSGSHCHVDPPQKLRVAQAREVFRRPEVDAEDQACRKHRPLHSEVDVGTFGDPGRTVSVDVESVLGLEFDHR